MPVNRLTFEEHTCGPQNVQPRSQGLSFTLGGEERETFNLVLRVSLLLLGTRRERDPGKERSKIKADFAGAPAPDSSLNDSHLTAHAWDSKVNLLTDYLFT